MEAIAKNVMEMSRLKVPVIYYHYWRGASGGAIGIGVGDQLLMLENTWYSVISLKVVLPYFGVRGITKKAAEALKLTATDMKKMVSLME